MAKKERKFAKYFGGEYMKYWYVAFVVVLGIMIFDMYNDRHVRYYELTVYNNAGEVIKQSEVENRNVESLALKLPITKAFDPVKKFEF
ncbi:hypothetical protein [Flexistipes sp.]|uniref:hypothetical protein n=1 Tax=Flexistipes sp. TaxID=3088135 RepID=UPI002E235006|nr:hypothetical protein [Flexistipes sp.]